MLSNSQQKLLRKLSSKKYRHQYALFIAEGRKVVQELLASGLEPEFIISSSKIDFNEEAIVVSEEELKRWSQLETPDQIIGVFNFPKFQNRESDTVLILDEINNPGNLGTIVRTCDWFGISKVYCAHGTVDVYNAKSIQSTMGSIARVELIYDDKETILKEVQEKGYDLYCAHMSGTPFNNLELGAKKALVMGSESHGPANMWLQNACAITIPKIGDSKVESLNVAIATAIILSSWY